LRYFCRCFFDRHNIVIWFYQHFAATAKNVMACARAAHIRSLPAQKRLPPGRGPDNALQIYLHVARQLFIRSSILSDFRESSTESFIVSFIKKAANDYILLFSSPWKFNWHSACRKERHRCLPHRKPNIA
jgi:hypothetical protein